MGLTNEQRRGKALNSLYYLTNSDLTTELNKREREVIENQIYPIDQTKCIDYCICPYCGHKFDGETACNGNMDCKSVICPECEKDIHIDLSIEYMCTVIED